MAHLKLHALQQVYDDFYMQLGQDTLAYVAYRLPDTPSHRAQGHCTLPGDFMQHLQDSCSMCMTDAYGPGADAESHLQPHWSLSAEGSLGLRP